MKKLLKIHSATLKKQLTHTAVHRPTHSEGTATWCRSVTECWPQQGSNTHTHTHTQLDHPSLPSDYHHLPQPPSLLLPIPPTHSSASPFSHCFSMLTPPFSTKFPHFLAAARLLISVSHRIPPLYLPL